MDYVVLIEGAAAGLAGGLMVVVREHFKNRRRVKLLTEEYSGRLGKNHTELVKVAEERDKAKKRARVNKKLVASTLESSTELVAEAHLERDGVQKHLEELIEKNHDAALRLVAANKEIGRFRTKLDRAVQDTNRQASDHALEREEMRSGLAKLQSEVQDLRSAKKVKVIQKKTEENDYHVELYSKWCVAKGELGQSIDSTLESFLKRIRTSEHALVLAHGCKSVRFDVEVQGTRVALVPAIIREEASA